MPLNIFWFIPTHGDGRFLATTAGGRPADFDYYSQVARAADSLGYEGVLLPTGRGCDDAWVTAAGLAAVTQRLKFLVAVRPGLVSPTVAYRMATTFDRHSRGRIGHRAPRESSGTTRAVGSRAAKARPRSSRCWRS